jgi:hypothetical protein
MVTREGSRLYGSHGERVTEILEEGESRWLHTKLLSCAETGVRFIQ